MTVEATAPVTEATSAEPVKDISGEEAKALWEAERSAKKAKPKDLGRADDGKFAAKAPVSTESAVKEAVAEAKRKLKIDDAEIDEEEVIKVYRERKGHQKAANKELQEGKSLRQQAENFIKMLKDPKHFKEVASKLGHNPRELAEKLIAEELEMELMDPRDAELKKAKLKLQEFEDIDKRNKAAIEERHHNEMKEKYAKDYNEQFVAALEEAKLPPTKPMVAEMAKYIARSAKIGFKMTASEAAQLVREDILLAHQRLIGDADGETLIKLVGEQTANKIRKWDTSRIKNPEAQLKTPAEQADERTVRRSPSKRMTPREWRDYNRAR